VTKKPSKPPASGPRGAEGRRDSETSTVIAKAVDPALLRAAGRPPIPRPDPSRPKRPAEPKPEPSATPAAPQVSSIPVAPLPEVSFADLDESDAKDHTLAVRGFVLPRAALPEGVPSPVGSDYAFDDVRVPTFPPQPDAFSSVPPAPLPGPARYPSDITRVAVAPSAPPSTERSPGSVAPSIVEPPPSSRVGPPSSRSGEPPSSRARALAASIESPRTKVPTLLVDRTTLLAARAVNKRESIVLASVDGQLDVEALAGETGFLPSETVEIVLALVARGILSVK